MNQILTALFLLAAAVPAAAQEEFLEFVELANRVIQGGTYVDKETEHFTIRAPRAGAEVLAPHAEKIWSVLSECFGVQPQGKIKVTFHLLDFPSEELQPGEFDKYDAESETLHFRFDYDWRRDFARGITGAFILRLSPERTASIPPSLLHGLKAYFGNFEPKIEGDTLHNPSATHFHVAKRAQSWAGRGKLLPGKKFADLKTEEVDDFEPATWSLASYLLNAKGKRDELKTWMAAHAGGKEAVLPAMTEAEVTKWANGLDVKRPDREEGRYLVADTMYYSIYVQKGTARVKPVMNDKQILDDLKKRMDLIFVKYAQAFKVEKFIRRRPKLYYYKDQMSYVRSGGPSSALAHYMSRSKTLVGWENYDKVLTSFHVLAHEGCHQFFDLAFPGFYGSDEMPSWFSEGLADCFGSCEIRGGELFIFTTTGCAADYAPGVRDQIKEGRYTPLKELFSMDHNVFMANANIHYPQSWSICHFLWNTGYKEVLVRLIDGFKRGKPRDEVYAAAFVKDGRKIDIDALEREWVEYAKRIMK